jgi:hypothetical protein
VLAIAHPTRAFLTLPGEGQREPRPPREDLS